MPRASASDQAQEVCATRRPAVSYYQVVKVGREVLRHYTVSNIEAARRKDCKAQRTHIEEQSRKVYEALQRIDNGDISAYSWNLVAELEAENPMSAQDDFVVRHDKALGQRYPTAQFDPHAVFDEIARLERPRRVPAQDSQPLKVPLCNMAGRVAPRGKDDEPQSRHTVLSRLTQGRLPVLEVNLPGKLSTFLLGRAVTYEGVPYRVDVAGGSKMKEKTERLGDIFARSAATAQEEDDAPPAPLHALAACMRCRWPTRGPVRPTHASSASCSPTRRRTSISSAR